MTIKFIAGKGRGGGQKYWFRCHVACGGFSWVFENYDGRVKANAFRGSSFQYPEEVE